MFSLGLRRGPRAQVVHPARGRCWRGWMEPGTERGSTALLPPHRCCHLPSLSLSVLHWRRDSLRPSSQGSGSNETFSVNDHVQTIECDRETLKLVRKVRPRRWVIGGTLQTSSRMLGGGRATVNAVGIGPDGHSVPPSSFTVRWLLSSVPQALTSPEDRFCSRQASSRPT